MSHYHFCPGREKQRSKTALGDPNREYLKYQKNGKWGWGHLFNLSLLQQQQEEFSEGSRRKGWESREVARRHSAAGRKQDLEGSKEQWCENWSSDTLATWRVDSLEKTLMLGKTEGRRRRGWQRMRWLDSTTDSKDMNLCKVQEVVKDREPGVLLSMGSQRETRLSDWTATTKEQWVQKGLLLPKPKSSRSHSQTHVHALHILLKYRLWFSRSGWGSSPCLSNKLPGAAGAVGLRTTLWATRVRGLVLKLEWHNFDLDCACI